MAFKYITRSNLGKPLFYFDNYPYIPLEEPTEEQEEYEVQRELWEDIISKETGINRWKEL